MTNAADEFAEHVAEAHSKIKATKIRVGYCYDPDEEKPFAYLKVDYSEQDFDKFMEKMNFNYDSGYGGQELYGTIWYEDGTWSDRGEYDGSEWWEHNSVPDIPEDLK